MRASIRPSKAEPDNRRRGRKPRPRSDAEAAVQEAERQNSAARTRLTSKTRRWITAFIANGMTDPEEAARSAGIARPDRCRSWPEKYAELLEVENLRARMSRQMELDEALIGVADLARTSPDLKVKLQSYRTVLEVHGALSAKPLPPGDRKTLLRELEEMVGGLKKRLSGAGGNEPKVRIAVGFEVESGGDGEKHENQRKTPILEGQIVDENAISTTTGAGESDIQ